MTTENKFSKRLTTKGYIINFVGTEHLPSVTRTQYGSQGEDPVRSHLLN